MHEIGKRQLFQRSPYYPIDDLLIVLDWAATLEIAQSNNVGAAIGQRNRPFERSDDVGNRNFLGIPGQAIPAFNASLRNQKPALLQDPEKLAYGRHRQP